MTHTKTERKALSDTHHPFLVHLRFAFQSLSKLYLVMDYCNGGKLVFPLKEAADSAAAAAAARKAAALRPDTKLFGDETRKPMQQFRRALY